MSSVLLLSLMVSFPFGCPLDFYLPLVLLDFLVKLHSCKPFTLVSSKPINCRDPAQPKAGISPFATSLDASAFARFLMSCCDNAWSGRYCQVLCLVFGTFLHKREARPFHTNIDVCIGHSTHPVFPSRDGCKPEGTGVLLHTSGTVCRGGQQRGFWFNDPFCSAMLLQLQFSSFEWILVFFVMLVALHKDLLLLQGRSWSKLELEATILESDAC